MSAEILAGQPEYFAFAFLSVRPEERQFRKFSFKNFAARSKLAQDSAALVQSRRRFRDDAPDDIKSIGAASMGDNRLSAKFRRKICDCVRIDIGRVGQDQIEFLLAERCEKIALMKRDAMPKPVFRDIAAGDLKRFG